MLLDNLAIMRATDYMKPLTILDPIHAESAPVQLENAGASKATQWVWKRKVVLFFYSSVSPHSLVPVMCVENPSFLMLLDIMCSKS